jgi:hypothetical protein
MPDIDARLARAIERIDAANAEDPKGEALAYGERMSEWLERLRPDAPPALRIAVRAQHIRRWKIPRDDYPRDRVGYLKWRTALYDFHADEAEAILRAVGYDDDTVTRVRKMLRKKELRKDAEVQALEDVACLVFLEHYFAEFAQTQNDDKVVDILRKTWKKMSERAHDAALSLSRSLEERERRLVERALSG